MIFTQRQIEALYKTRNCVVLPIGSRLSPLAKDWIKSRKIDIEYGETPPAQADVDSAGCAASSSPEGKAKYLWWCDGPCGQAKAAISPLERELGLRLLEIEKNERAILLAIRSLAQRIAKRKCDAAILLVRSGATAMVYANRCASIRAILGTCGDAVEQGIRLIGANMLVIEHPHKTLSQVRSMAARFLKAPHQASAEVSRLLQELSTCA